jgi:hypothetical protein
MIKIILLIQFVLLTTSCATAQEKTDLTPLTESEVTLLINKNSIQLNNIFNQVVNRSTSSCMKERSEFGLTEVCKSFEHNIIYIQINNKVIFQSQIFTQQEKEEEHKVNLTI